MSQCVCSVLQGKLRDHIQNPSAVDLVHFLFTPLRMVGVNSLISINQLSWFFLQHWKFHMWDFYFEAQCRCVEAESEHVLTRVSSWTGGGSLKILRLYEYCPFVLLQVIQTSGSVDLARSVVVPLLTREAIDFLHSSGTAEERHLWVTLGDGWTKCRWDVLLQDFGALWSMHNVRSTRAHTQAPTPAWFSSHQLYEMKPKTNHKFTTGSDSAVINPSLPPNTPLQVKVYVKYQRKVQCSFVRC